jgi:hypothetical protein
MNPSRFTRTVTHSGCLAALAGLGLVVGCSNAPAGPHEELASPAPALPAGKPLAAPVDVPLQRGFVRIAKSVHPFARPELEAGRLDPSQRITSLSLFFSLSPEQRRDRDALVAAQLDPRSPQFRRWLTPETYRARFGARPEDIARASAWLGAQGFVVHRTSRLGNRVVFSGTVAQLEAAFQTEMHHYVVGGETHYAMATAPAIPSDLAPVVLGLHNTHDFYKQPVSSWRNASALGRANPAFTLRFDAGADAGPDAGQFNVLAPPDWATAYDVARLYSPGIGGQALDGTGVTIGIVGDAQIALEDIDAFRTQFGIPALGANWTMTVVPDTGAAQPGRRGNGIEAILDNEWSGAVARGAKVNFVVVGAEDHNVDDASFYLIEENLAPVMSESFGGCEAGELPADADFLEENGTAANLMGITYMAATGDTGAEGCGGGPFGTGMYVETPSSFPGVTGVGGTEFPSPSWSSSGNLESYPSVEAVWNEWDDPYSSTLQVGAGGGGISSVFARPLYQPTSTCAFIGSLPVPETASQFRMVPDVALSAASATPGYLIECTPNSTGSDCSNTGGMPVSIPVGGTSASTPSFAGIVAILNQAAGERLGNINPLLYALATSSPTAFHDIVTGNNEIACGPGGIVGDAGGPGDGGFPDSGCSPNGLYGFPATPGYDCATGLGSIDAYNLAMAVIGTSATKTKTSLTATPIMGVSPGEPVALTATVDLAGASSGTTIGGAVTFTFESFTTTGATDLSWELGSVAVQGTATSAVASLSTPIPPGLVKPGQQFVDVVAVYSGDATHLASTSAKVGVGFVPLTFAIDPPTAMLAPNATETFTTTGGTAPVQWGVDFDSTRGRVVLDGGGMAFGGAGFIGDGGTLSVGPKPGYVEISALDKNGIEAIARITVGVPDGGAPWAGGDGGVYIDAAVPPAFDAGVAAVDAAAAKDGSVAARDAGVAKDASAAKDAARDAAKDGGGRSSSSKDAAKDVEVDSGPPELSSGGCNCDVRGARSSDDARSGAGLAGLLLGLSFIGRARRRRTAR